MPKVVAGIIVTVVFVIVLVFSFTLYAQFALDYSLESLKEALQTTQDQNAPQAHNQAYRSNLEGLIVEEVTRKDLDYKSVVLLEHAARSIRDAIERSGYARANAYVSEVVKEKSSRRNLFLRLTDSVYYFVRSFTESFRKFWLYLTKRLLKKQDSGPLLGTGVLILGEAERMEKIWNLEEAERYYREFLERYPGRAERGFVIISLAHVLTKMRRLDDAEELLGEVVREFPGGQEEMLAASLLSRIESMRKRLSRLPELEAWILNQPDRIFKEEGGLELALSYIATFQIDRALSVLRKLNEAPDPRIRAKALFYQGLLLKWDGDLTSGKAIFQFLQEQPGLETALTSAAQAELADIHYEGKEYDLALSQYEKFSQGIGSGPLKALSELEQGDIRLFRIGNAEAARKQLEKLKELYPESSPQFKQAYARLEEALKKSAREEGFRALAEGRVDTAKEIFQSHLKKFSQDGQAHSALGSIHLLQGDLVPAVEEAEKGFGLQSDEYTASVLGYVYEKIGELDKAERYYLAGINLNRSYLIAWFNLAVVQLTREKYQEAGELLQGIANWAPPLPAVVQAKVLNNLGCALWGLGRREEAKTQFHEALKVVPTFVEARENLNLGTEDRPVQTATEAPLLR